MYESRFQKAIINYSPTGKENDDDRGEAAEIYEAGTGNNAQIME